MVEFIATNFNWVRPIVELDCYSETTKQPNATVTQICTVDIHRHP